MVLLLTGAALTVLGLWTIGKLTFGSWAGDPCEDCAEFKARGIADECPTCYQLRSHQ